MITGDTSHTTKPLKPLRVKGFKGLGGLGYDLAAVWGLGFREERISDQGTGNRE